MYPWQAAALECGEAYNNLVGCPCLPAALGRHLLVGGVCLRLSLLEPRSTNDTEQVAFCTPIGLQVYCAPTSGGKSLVAEVLMVRRLVRSTLDIPQPRRSKPVRLVWAVVCARSKQAGARLCCLHAAAGAGQALLGWQ